MSVRYFIIILFSYSLHGHAQLSGIIHVSKKNTAHFKITSVTNNYFLELRPHLSKRACLYKVRKISAPAMLKGRNGIIQADKMKCNFNLADKSQNTFWNKIITIDMIYYFTSNQKLEGEASLSSLEKMTKVKVRINLSNN
jgi:hypothetical protein